jgi:hypothetical protein
VRARLGELLYGGATDTITGTGNDHDFVVKIQL